MGHEMDCAWCHCIPCDCKPGEGRKGVRGNYQSVFHLGRLIGYSAVTTRGEADRIAKAEGAVMVGVSYYPIRLYSIDKTREVSNIHYFYANGTEVGYWCPQFEQFHLMKGRKWYQPYKDELDLKPLEV